MKRSWFLSEAFVIASIIFLMTGCAQDSSQTTGDNGQSADGGSLTDAGLPADGGQVLDGGAPQDAGFDAGMPDAGAPDAGGYDSGGPIDTGTNDAGEPDAGNPDSGAQDAGMPDDVGLDAGSTDAGTQDDGSLDAGLQDSGAADAGLPDTGSTDTGAGPSGDTCLNAFVISVFEGSPMVLTSQTTAGFFNDYNITAACDASSSSGPDRVYAVNLPAGKTLTATVTPGSWDPMVLLLGGPAESCGPSTCLAGKDGATSGKTESVSFTNNNAVSMTVYVVVDSSGPADGNFTLEAAISTPVAGDSCFNAIPVIPGVLTSQTTVGFLNDYNVSPACGAVTSSGPDRVYSIDVPVGKVLVATVTPGSWDPTILLLAGPAGSCGPSTCLAGKDDGATGEAETVDFFNGSGAPRTVYIVVDGYSQSQSGTFTLTTGLSDP